MEETRFLSVTKSLSRLFAAVLLLGAGGSANAIVIDFEGHLGLEALNIGDFIDIGDYRFTLSGAGGNSGGFTTSLQIDIVEPGTTKLWAANESEITMTRIDDSAFDLISLDIGGSIINSPNRWADSVNIIAGASTTNVSLDGSDTTYQYVALNYLNVTSVLFDPIGNTNGGANNYEFVIDNLDVAAVPIPAALWLFASGLLSLAGIARRKKV